VDIEDELSAKGVALSILSPAMDTNTPSGRLTFSIFGAVAQFEREIMLERQLEGIRKAKEAGKYKGRSPTAKMHSARVLASLALGEAIADVAKRYGMTPRSVYRIKAEDKRARSVG
jgi:DNA invertase Pin-like site-specific DNA recombinase